jgi:hypothetical protein
MYRGDGDRARAAFEVVEEQLTEAHRSLAEMHRRRSKPTEWLEERASSLVRAARLFQREVNEAAQRPATGKPADTKRRQGPRGFVLGVVGVAVGITMGAAGMSRLHAHQPVAQGTGQAEAPIEDAPPPMLAADPEESTQPEASTPPAPPAAAAHEKTAEAPAPPSGPPRWALAPQDYSRMLELGRAFFDATHRHDGRALAKVTHPVFGVHISETDDDLHQDVSVKDVRDCFALTTSDDGCAGPADACGRQLGEVGELPFEKSTWVTFNEPGLGDDVGEWQAWATYTLVNSASGPLIYPSVTLRFGRFEGKLWVTGVFRQNR